MDFRDIKEFCKDTFKYVIVIVIILLLAIYVVSFQQVVGVSMNPTLEDGDVLLINKLSPSIFSLERNDIIVLVNDSNYLVKRVIGLPGETVRYEDNKLYINDELVEEDIEVSLDFNLEDLGYDVIPEGMYFVLGDNRLDSKDSIDIGLIAQEDIIGEAIFRIYPFTKITLT